MPKTITSPVKCWPGTIIISEPLSWPQYLAWKRAVQAARDLPEIDEQAGLLIGGVCACVEKWELGGSFPAHVSPETWPASPHNAAMRLLGTLVGAIGAVINAEDGDPNA
jgi:hypothetical protein